MQRCELLRAGAAALGLALLPGRPRASRYPNRPVRLLVGFPAGSASDARARLAAQHLGAALQQPFVVENIPGNAATLAASLALRAEADGHTLLVSSHGPLVIAPLVNPHVKLDPARAFATLGLLSNGGYVLLVRADAPYRSVADLVAAARARPGKLSYSSSGTGSGNHLLMEMLKQATGTDLLHVPYKGASPSLNDLAGGIVDASFETWIPAAPLVEAGKLRPLAVTAAQREAFLPRTPTLAEAGHPEVNGDFWVGLFAPAATPRPVQALLAQATRQMLALPEYQAAVQQAGSGVKLLDDAELAGFLPQEVARWRPVLQRLKLAA
jgi:tripartite-type tricarboxylate transporter receptor subunit TctC